MDFDATSLYLPGMWDEKSVYLSIKTSYASKMKFQQIPVKETEIDRMRNG